MKDPPCLNKALRGDRDALEELAAACHAAVLGFFLRRAGSRERAMDLAQDTLLRVLEGLEEYRPRPGAGFLAWVFRIARNRWVDSLRGGPAEELLDADDYSEPSTPGDATSLAALGRLEAEGLGRALSQLMPGDRELLELRYYLGFSHREMAGVLGITPQIVKSRLNTALGRLRAKYASMEKGNGYATKTYTKRG